MTSRLLLVAVLAVVGVACGGAADTASPLATPTVSVNHTRVPLGSPIEVTYRFQVAPSAAFDKDYRDATMAVRAVVLRGTGGAAFEPAVILEASHLGRDAPDSPALYDLDGDGDDRRPLESILPKCSSDTFARQLALARTGLDRAEAAA